MARYTFETARALAERHGDLIAAYVLNPDLPPADGIESFVATGRVCFSTEAAWETGAIWHVVSPIELDVPIERQWPIAASRAGLRVVVTVHDLIPERLPDRYLADPGLRHRFRARLELIRHANHVLTISQCSARDTTEILGVSPSRISVVGSAPAPFFRPATGERARPPVTGLRDRFVLYTAGMDDRKNLEGLLAAWSRVDPELRAQVQLVIACRASALERNHYETRARAYGVGGSVLLTGWVPDEVLVVLNQTAELAVFPSLYEGFGLPVVEALACGTPVIAANTSSLPELLDPIALFDPHDTGAMAAAITRALVDEAHRAVLQAQCEKPVPSWADVADRMADAYHAVARRPAPARRRATRMALVSPLPPQRTGIAEWSSLLLEQLGEHGTVDAFADGFHLDTDAPVAPEGIEVHPARTLRFVEAARGGYDTVIYCLGNSEFHAGALAELRRRPGVVLAHEARLTDLYALSADRPGAVPDGFAATLERLYGDVVPSHLQGLGRLDHDDAARLGILMAREIVELSTRFVTTNEFAADLARIDAGPELAGRIEAMPFAIFAPNRGVAPPAPPGPPIIATFGVVHSIKRPDVIVDAVARVRDAIPGAHLVIVGRASDDAAGAVRERAALAGLADAVEITGAVDEATYAGWLARATIAVQLRTSSNGESSGAIGNCLAFGVPTIVGTIGAAGELPDDAVVKVPPDIDAGSLAAAIVDLLEHDERRRSLSAGALAYADAHTHARAAAWIWDHLVTPLAAATHTHADVPF